MSSQLWQILMDQLNKVNQDNKHLKKVARKKVQQNQANALKLKTLTTNENIKTNETEQVKAAQQRTDGYSNTHASMQAILSGKSQKSDCNSDSQKDHLNIDLILTAQQ